MSQTQTLEGTIKPDGTLKLAGRIDLPPGQVRVVVEMLAPQREPTNDILAVLQEIKRVQLERGYAGQTVDEMRADEEAAGDEGREYEARWDGTCRQTDHPEGRPEQ